MLAFQCVDLAVDCMMVGFDLKLWFWFFFSLLQEMRKCALIVFVKFGDLQCGVIVWVCSSCNLVPIIFSSRTLIVFSFRYESSVDALVLMVDLVKSENSFCVDLLSLWDLTDCSQISWWFVV